MTQKCGYIALVGRPNAGKSTLMNACIGAKISVVSAKPQTTRNKIVGISTDKTHQLLFLDTPGMHKADNLPRINRTMNKVAWNGLTDADVVCYLVDSVNGWHQEDEEYVTGLLKRGAKNFRLVVTKIDKLKKDFLDESVQRIRSRMEICLEQLEPKIEFDFEHHMMLISSKRPIELDYFRSVMNGLLPEHPWMYPEDDLTDMPQKFICAEMVREQLFRQLGDELPYSCGVKIDVFEEKTNLIKILATIIVQKEMHKRIVIGNRGSRIKEIGVQARQTLERHLDCQVYLELFVKVQEGWVDNDALIAEYASLRDPNF